MTDRRWKAAERKVAKLLGGQRTSHKGAGLGAPDVVGSAFVAEVKYRSIYPLWLLDALVTARRHSGDGRLGLVVLREKGKRGGMVLLDLEDFREWFGGVEKESGHEPAGDHHAD